MIEYLKKGEANATSREELVKLSGYSDRIVREKIEKEREKHCIGSNSQTKGYFICETDEEVNHFIAEHTKRAVKELRLIRRFSNNWFNKNQVSL